MRGSDVGSGKGAPDKMASLYPLTGEFLETDRKSEEIDAYGCLRVMEKVSRLAIWDAEMGTLLNYSTLGWK